MSNTTKKLFLSIKSSDSSNKYYLEFDGQKFYPNQTDTDSFEFDLDISKRNVITVHYIDKSLPSSYLQIVEMKYNNTKLNNFELFTNYITIDNKVKKTYNWLDQLGVFKINIHGNAVIHQLLAYILSNKQKNLL